ncbi:hypothetical protein MPER_05824 [Moniliophthora perniciosa FA553]|nr:hypothetical protein MPER_05824 [Moniliophthora perniciosa FA553]
MAPDFDIEPFRLEEIVEPPEKELLFPGHLGGFVSSPEKAPAAKRLRRQRPKKRLRTRNDDTSGLGVVGSSNTATSVGDADASLIGQTTAGGIWDPEPMAYEMDDGIPDASAMEENDAYEEYIQLVEDHYLAFVQVTNVLYVVQGFDLTKKEGTVSLTT